MNPPIPSNPTGRPGTTPDATRDVAVSTPRDAGCDGRGTRDAAAIQQHLGHLFLLRQAHELARGRRDRGQVHETKISGVRPGGVPLDRGVGEVVRMLNAWTHPQTPNDPVAAGTRAAQGRRPETVGERSD